MWPAIRTNNENHAGRNPGVADLAILQSPAFADFASVVRRKYRPSSGQTAKSGLARISLLLRNFVPVPDFALAESYSL
jgi:hypothetical protein